MPFFFISERRDKRRLQGRPAAFNLPPSSDLERVSRLTQRTRSHRLGQLDRKPSKIYRGLSAECCTYQGVNRAPYQRPARLHPQLRVLAFSVASSPFFCWFLRSLARCAARRLAR